MSNKKILTFLIILAANASIVFPQSMDRKILVGTKVAEPFVIKQSDGRWSGLSIELWDRIAKDLGVKYEIKEYELEDLLKAVKNEKVDIAVSPLTITSEREKVLDFTHAYFTTGLSIAVINKSSDDIFGILKSLFTIKFMKVVFLSIIVLLFVGILVWVFERNRNKEQFGDGKTKGLGSSVWWAAVTMTTVGYGDKTPKTSGGRIIAVLWMFAGLVMISAFTAAITSALTVDQLDVGINFLSDLYNVRVGTVKSSSSEEYLTQNSVDFITTQNIEGGINLIKQNKIDAFVYDAPILK